MADGSSVHTQRWLNYLADKVDEIHLICWKVIPGYDSRIKIHTLKRYAAKLWPVSQYFNFAGWCVQVRRLIKDIKPDIVDGHFVTSYGFIAATTGFHPLVITAWGSDILILPKRNQIYKYTAKYAMRHADMVICTGRIVKQEISRLGIDPDITQVVVVGGVDTNTFQPGVKDRVLLNELGIGQGQPVIISTRNLAPVYDVATLLKAFPTIISSFPSAKLIVVGKGIQENDLRELARSLGILENVVFTGWIKPSELPKYLFSSDIYVSTSLSDGTSNSLLEAMASGLAVVVSDIPANRQWIQVAENGFLFPIKDHVALAEQVVKLLGDTGKRKTLGELARHTVEQNADPETEMQKLISIYQRLLPGEK